MLAHSQQSIRRLIVIQNYNIFHKLIILSLCIPVIMLAGCTSAAVSAAAEPTEIPTAAVPTAIPKSAEPSVKSEPKSEPASDSLQVTPTVEPQTENAAPSSSHTPIRADAELSAPDTGTPVPTPGLASENPDATTTPTVTPAATPTVTPAATPTVTPTAAPTPAASAGSKTEPVKVVYPINSFKDDSVLCLTFDDGGDKKSVKRALEVLDQYDIKCTFFVIGKYLKPNADLWKQAIEQGHQICNHTQNHKWLSELSNEEVKKEILDWEASAAEVLGEEYVAEMKKEFAYLRMPGGAGSNSKRVLGIVKELGYTPVGWNVETYYAVLRHHDLKNEPVSDIADEVTAHVTKRASSGSIILLHFNPYDTTRLDAILDGILAKKLIMKLLSEQGI